MKGKVKAGTDAAVPDDELMLTAAFVFGATPPLLDGSEDVLLSLRSGNGDPLNLLVQGGRFVAKGKKKLTVSDADGSVIERISDAPSGQDVPPPPPPTLGGSLVVKKSKKRAVLLLKVRGVDAAQFDGTVDATLAVGTQTAAPSGHVHRRQEGPEVQVGASTTLA